jgi:hypothetical protein
MARKVLWRGSQWIVTPNAIVCPSEGNYSLHKSRAAALWYPSSQYLGWPCHLGEKRWVDLEDFEAAYRFAIKAWGIDVPEELIVKSFKRGWTLR